MPTWAYAVVVIGFFGWIFILIGIINAWDWVSRKVRK